MFSRGPDTRHPPIIPVGNFTSNNDLPPGAVNPSDYCPDYQAKLVMRKQDKARFCGACGWGYPGDLDPSQQLQQPQNKSTTIGEQTAEAEGGYTMAIPSRSPLTNRKPSEMELDPETKALQDKGYTITHYEVKYPEGVDVNAVYNSEEQIRMRERKIEEEEVLLLVLSAYQIQYNL